jgi:hypothetical protein
MKKKNELILLPCCIHTALLLYALPSSLELNELRSSLKNHPSFRLSRTEWSQVCLPLPFLSIGSPRHESGSTARTWALLLGRKDLQRGQQSLLKKITPLDAESISAVPTDVCQLIWFRFKESPGITPLQCPSFIKKRFRKRSQVIWGGVCCFPSVRIAV